MTTISLLSGIFLLFISVFTVYAMFKNEHSIQNKWLSLFSWFMWVVVTIYAGYHIVGYVKPEWITGKTDAATYIPGPDIILGLCMFFFSMYLFSLSNNKFDFEQVSNRIRIALKNIFTLNNNHHHGTIQRRSAGVVKLRRTA